MMLCFLYIVETSEMDVRSSSSLCSSFVALITSCGFSPLGAATACCAAIFSAIGSVSCYVWDCIVFLSCCDPCD